MFDAISSDTLAAILLVVFVFQLNRLMGFLNLSKVRMRSSEWTPIMRSRVPADTLHLLDCAKTGLEGMGFELIGTQTFEPPNFFDPRTHDFADFYWHPEKAIVAIVELAESLSGQVTKVHFVSMFEDGKTLMTVNREQWSQLPVPEEILIVDAYADDLAEQWKFHQETLAKETINRVTITDRLKVFQRLPDIGLPRCLAHMQETGWARKEASGTYRFTPRGAWRYSGQVTKPGARARSALARTYRHVPAPDIKIARMTEMHSVAAHIELASQPLPSWVKATLFVVTLILSAILFGNYFTPMSAAAVLTVLLVHELGHLTAMWAFDYRNLSIFFLPFLGAAATGHKPHASPWQEAIVLLAGPVPGLILALAATQIPSETLPLSAIEFIREFVFFSLVVNLFNLLPVGVLDGGRLFELAVLGRFPLARALFAALGVAVGLTYAFWAESWLLGVAMLLLLIGIPLQFKVAKITSAIRARTGVSGLKSLGKEEVITALGQEFSSENYGSTNAKGWIQRLNIAKLAYPRLLQGIPRLSVSIGALTLQGFAFFVPLVLYVWSLQQPEQTPLMRLSQAEQEKIEKQISERPVTEETRVAREAFMARYEAEHDPAAKWTMLEMDFEDASEVYFLDPAWVMQQKTALLESLPADHPGKLRHLLYMAAPDSPGKAETILSVIALLTENKARIADLDEERLALLMDAYTLLAIAATPDVLTKQTTALDALWSDLETADPPKALFKSQLASIRAHMSFSAGNFEEATTWMDRYVANAEQTGGFATLTKGWFLIDIGQADQALALATRTIATDEQRPINRSQWQTLAGWAEMNNGHPREADVHFQAAQEEIAAQMEESLDALPWWMRLITGDTAANLQAQMPVTPQILDHLAALEGYDPQQAALLQTELRNKITPEWKERMQSFPGKFNGWGKAREAAHEKIIKAIYTATTTDS